VPLFDRNQAPRAEAGAREDAARARLVLAEARARAEADGARAAYARAAEAAKAARAATEGVARMVEGALAAYRASEAGLTDLLDAAPPATPGCEPSNCWTRRSPPPRRGGPRPLLSDRRFPMTAAFPRLRAAARAALALLLAAAALAACSRPPTIPRTATTEPWAVTAWTDAHEIFAEVEPLVAGKPASSNTHVTVLADFSPLREGTVSAVLRGPDGEAVFTQAKPRRDGIFVIEMRPSAAGTFSLSYRVEHGGKRDEIPAGRVRVGSDAEPGSLVEGPAPPHGAPAAAEGGIEVPVLKEQQWRTPFSTVWARAGRLPGRVAGPARVLPAAGGEATLTAAVDATVASRPWPYPGQAVAQGDAALQARAAWPATAAWRSSRPSRGARCGGGCRPRARRLWRSLLALGR
jgi:hypothetical protein